MRLSQWTKGSTGQVLGMKCPVPPLMRENGKVLTKHFDLANKSQSVKENSIIHYA